MIDYPVIPSNVTSIYIDVGLAADCPHTIQWLREDPNSFVFGFEPVPFNCQRVSSLIESLGYSDRFCLIECAIDDIEEEKEVDFFVTRNSEVLDDHGQSSLFRLQDSWKDSMWVDEVIQVKVVSLAVFLNLVDWCRFPFVSGLKTDTQGNDLAILKSIESYFDKIPKIKCESHCYGQYKDDDSPYPLAEFLTSKGYTLITPVMSPDHEYVRI